MKRSEESMSEIDRALDYTDRSYFTVGYGASRRINNDTFIASNRDDNNPRYASVKTLFDPNAGPKSLSNLGQLN